MKLKIIFSEPPHAPHSAIGSDEQVLVIKSPYKLTQAKLGDERIIQKEDGTKVNYEVYCEEMNQLLANTLKASKINTLGPFDNITVTGFQQPPLFKSICSALEQTPQAFAPATKLTFNQCSFGGALYVDSVSKLVQTTQKQQPVIFKIYLEESGKSKVSRHDEARLASLNGVTFYRNESSPSSKKPFIDDSLIGIKKTPLQAQFENPTYHYREALQGLATGAEKKLRNFFNMAAQQQNDYTCGPATLRMVADYYDTMSAQSFCNQPIAQPKVWHKINANPEMELAAQVKTTEADGSDISGIRTGLMNMGLTVLDDDGVSNKKYSKAELDAHKEILWKKMQEIIKLGIPVILNMQDRDGCGHFEVVIGIENTGKGEQIILGEPGTALTGALEFETTPKEQFISRWKNMSGEFHGRFMVLPPNEAAAQAVGAILAGVPHCMNGVDKHRVDDSKSHPMIADDWSKDDYRNSQKEKFLQSLGSLKTKCEERLKDFPEAQGEAQEIISQLIDAANTFYASSPTKEMYNQFEKACDSAFKADKTLELQEHRDTFGEVFAAIKNFFVVLKKTLFSENTTKDKFLDTRTDSAKIVDTLKGDVEEAKNSVFRK